MITVVDYGMGNLASVINALRYLNIPSKVSMDSEEIMSSKGIIVPGVGAFPDAMDNLRSRGLDLVLKKARDLGKPILGICLGMQLLFEESEEVRRCTGLGILKGVIRKLDIPFKVPHMGWNSLVIKHDNILLRGIKEGSYMYFVHSYYAEIGEEGILDAYSDYGRMVPAVVSSGNVYGTQFHPEKSGREGMKILKNFGELTL